MTRAKNLEIITCKDCKYWTEYCKHSLVGQKTVCTGADFYCENAERKDK